ncbi:Cupin domain-containing protein [Orenia metallireducens]|uniref:Cupin domain-containing protein n=1 Tax=Orenia metallireducens TaxID=1413210 RepID=A0A285H9R4_9FIRM|nr:cupin domain-containing protein [Orenia metallireducens]PRX28908.1 Cupin domain-containing protein [Orenia metallireducens]SNY32468.1 Cupin domain-containing protein [Orenia metallireducens]
MSEFIVPPNHFKFKAKKLLGEVEGKIVESSVAYIESGGGGPRPSHTHSHDHLFIIVEGSASIEIEGEKIKVESDESILVPGRKLHSVWNEADELLKMIGITIKS